MLRSVCFWQNARLFGAEAVAVFTTAQRSSSSSFKRISFTAATSSNAPVFSHFVLKERLSAVVRSLRTGPSTSSRFPSLTNRCKRIASFSVERRELNSVVPRRRLTQKTEKENNQTNASEKEASKKTDDASALPVEQMSLFQRFKHMWKKYWYIVIPVHLVTSTGWFGSFFYISLSGFNVIGFLEKLGVPDKILSPLRNSPKAGHLAVAYALYKIATPVRYMVTLAGTHLCIRVGSRFGWIKPLPSRAQMQQIVKQKRAEFRDRREEAAKVADKMRRMRSVNDKGRR